MSFMTKRRLIVQHLTEINQSQTDTLLICVQLLVWSKETHEALASFVESEWRKVEESQP